MKHEAEAYLSRLPESIREMLRRTHLQMFRAGCTKPDLRWLEQYAHICPVCGEADGEPGVVATLTYPTAEGMTYVPYIICAPCTAFCLDDRLAWEEGDGPLRLQSTLFEHLDIDIDPEQTFLRHIPPEHRVAVWEAVEDAADSDTNLSLAWLIQCPRTCAACGREIRSQSQLRTAILVLRRDDNAQVEMPFLLCPGCSLRPTAQIQSLAADRLTKVFLEDVDRRGWVLAYTTPKDVDEPEEHGADDGAPDAEDPADRGAASGDLAPAGSAGSLRDEAEAPAPSASPAARRRSRLPVPHLRLVRTREPRPPE